MTPDDPARRAAMRAARTSYGRLLAMLASRGTGLAAAEDALGDALASALAAWPARGVPDNPDAWLLTAARRSLGAARARSATAAASEAVMILLDAERGEAAPIPFGDARLKLMFVCAHPAIDPSVQAPLMLQTVLGLDAARIAASFMVTPAAMGQKLVRAKARIRDAGIAFAIPPADRIAGRLDSVRAAIYAAFGTGWDAIAGADARARGLAQEAIWLARVLFELTPQDPESHGLLALLLFCQARCDARRDAAGGFVPLAAQDPHAWDAAMLAEAEALLRAAARYGVPGRFQLEAAIQSLHAERVMTGIGNPAALAALYDLLVTFAPSMGALVARAAALAEAGDAPAALAALDAVATRGAAYQPWWAARARALWLGGEAAAARAAATTAAGLATDPAVRRFLLSGALFA